MESLQESLRQRWRSHSRLAGHTAVMNPLVPSSVIAQAYADDEASAAAEFGAEFRKDIEVFIAREVVEACVISGRHELPPFPHIQYHAFVDPSGGSQDSMTLAVAHREQDSVILDLIREVKPPFSPEQIVKDFAQTLKPYRVVQLTGDRFAGQWCQEPFRKAGLLYQVADKTRSDLYRELLPLLNSQTVALLDHARLVTQLCGLERHTARSGKDSIDHAPNQHDDVANSVAGALVLAKGPGLVPGIFLIDCDFSGTTTRFG